MRIINVDQNSEEWFHKREGKITGSRAEATFVNRIANKSTMVDIIHDISGEDKKELNKLKLHELEERLPEDIKKDFYHQAQKKEYYQLLAEKLGYTDADEDGIYEDPRERGHRLEDTAAEFLEKEYDVNWGDEGKEFDCICGIKLEIKYDESYNEESNDEYSWWWLEKVNK
jgi:hypothetical protein